MATSISASRVDQTYVITVVIQNKSAQPVNSLVLAVTWLDGGHPRGGEFGIDAPDGHVLIAAGQAYGWKTTIQSTAVTKPLTALALSSTTTDGTAWFAPPGALPLTVK